MTIEATPIASDDIAADEEVVLATATLVVVGDAKADDIESQEEPISTAQETSVDDTTDKTVGRGIGYAMLILLIIGGICAIIAPFYPAPATSISIICTFAVLVLASVLACCGCCGITRTLPPNAQVFAVTVLLSVILIIFSTITWWYTKFIGIAADYAGYVTLAVCIALYIVAVLFTLLFIWGRDACCVPKQ